MSAVSDALACLRPPVAARLLQIYDVRMDGLVHVRVFRGEKYFVAEGLNSPVVTQALTFDELMESVKEGIALHLDGGEPCLHFFSN